MRDCDLAALPGLIATLTAAALLGMMPQERLRASMRVMLPLLVLLALGWVAVNADPAAGERRAMALIDGTRAPAAEQRNSVLVLLGYRALERREFAASARAFERASLVMPNPRHLLFASQGWLAAGELGSARRCLALAYTHVPLPPDVARTAATVRAMIDEVAAAPLPDSAR
jgi:hypothetical protein